jgi:hypothetical protein
MSLGKNPVEQAGSISIASSLATAVAGPCLQDGLTAYENARLDGLCHDGAWECAVAALSACPTPDATDFNRRLQTLHSLVQPGMAG